MATLRDEVTDPVKYSESRRRFREYCQSWKSHRMRTAVENVIRLALEDDRADDLYEVLLDEDYRALRQSISGTAALRADLEAGREYFSSRQPDLLRYMQIAFAGQETADSKQSLDGHRRNCQGFADFLQLDRLPSERTDMGLHKVLARLFPVTVPQDDEFGLHEGDVTIRLAGYELGDWACRCGHETGLIRRYDHTCKCGSRRRNGRLMSDRAGCPICGYRPAYERCAQCRTRVTLALLWRIRHSSADPSVYRVPLGLDLVIEKSGESKDIRFTLMYLPLPLGLREQEGQLDFGLPDVLWLGSNPGRSSADRFIGLSDQPRYDGRDDLRKILEAALRRTLSGRQGHRGFGKNLRNALVPRYGRPNDLTTRYTRGFEQRIGKNLGIQEQAQGNFGRFISTAVDCQVAASASLHDRTVLVNRRLTGTHGLSIPHRLNVATELQAEDGRRVIGAMITREPPGLTPNLCSRLDQWGLVSPGQLVEPGQVLVGAAITVSDEENLSPEDRLLRAIFGENPTRQENASLRMPGERPGRVVSLALRLRPGTGDGIPAGPGRTVESVNGRKPQEIVVSTEVTQPVQAGDTLVDDNGSEALVVGILGGAALRAKAGCTAEPDLLVAPGHPWAPGTGNQALRTVRIRLRSENRAQTAARSQSAGPYDRLTRQPATGTTNSYAQTLVAADYYWMITRGARQTAFELYGPRCDFPEWRSQLIQSPPSNGTNLNLPRTYAPEWSSLQDSPSYTVRRWDMLLRSARVLAKLDGEHISMRLMTDEDVLSCSNGEISKHMSFNYRTHRPEKGGLYCEEVFGPDIVWKCSCGKYRGGTQLDGSLCERCGVELTRAADRYRRMGHIDLRTPVVHSWYLRGPASIRLAESIGITGEDLLAIAACTVYVVTDPGAAPLHVGQLLRADQWQAIQSEKRIPSPYAVTGGAALTELLQAAAKRAANLFPQGIVMSNLPILPAGMRPAMIISSGYTESSYPPQLHYLHTLESVQGWPGHSLSGHPLNSRVQSSVNQLLDNESEESPAQAFSGETGFTAWTPQKNIASLAALLEDQKRSFLRRSVDYSATTLLVTGDVSDPDTALLPTRLAFDLFEPTIASTILNSGAAPDVPTARRYVRNRALEASRALSAVCENALILVSLGSSRWPIIAMKIRLSAESALQVPPQLLDDIGWEHLGNRVSIFSILTTEATDEALMLLTPSRLRTSDNPVPPSGMNRSAILDLLQGNVADEISSVVLDGRPLRLTGWDHLFLGDASWLNE